MRQTDVQSAIDIISGLAGEVLGYLDAMEQARGRLPKYFPEHFSFDAIRVNVEVSTERRQYTDAERRLWE